MKRLSIKELDGLESKLLSGDQTKEINNELAEEYLMVDLYSGFAPQETVLPPQEEVE